MYVHGRLNLVDRTGIRAGVIAALVTVAAIYAGSGRMKHFDWALSSYAVGCVFAAFAIAYRYAIWAQRPPTSTYLKRGWEMFIRRRSNAPRLAKRIFDNFLLQKFIARRS